MRRSAIGDEGDLDSLFDIVTVERYFTLEHAHPVPVFQGGVMGEEEREVHS